MHAGLAQPLQRMGAGRARIIAGEIVPTRGMKNETLEVIIRSPRTERPPAYASLVWYWKRRH